MLHYDFIPIVQFIGWKTESKPRLRNDFFHCMSNYVDYKNDQLIPEVTENLVRVVYLLGNSLWNYHIGGMRSQQCPNNAPSFSSYLKPLEVLKAKGYGKILEVSEQQEKSNQGACNCLLFNISEGDL